MWLCLVLAEAVDCYTKTIDARCDDGKFSNAAKMSVEVGDSLVAEGQSGAAAAFYEKAASIYDGESGLELSRAEAQKKAAGALFVGDRGFLHDFRRGGRP